MVKKKGKKGQKQVETAPPDSAPATGEPIPEVPEVPLTAEAPHSGTEGQPQTEIPATEVTSGEQSVPSLPEVEPTEGTVAVPAELPTPALSPHLENSEPIVSNTTQLPATEIASALEQDPTIKKEEEIEPQAVPTQITEGQNIEQNPEAPQPTTTAASENVQPMPTEATKVPATVTATLALKQNQSLANEEDSTQSLGESAHASLLNSRSETAEEPERVTPEPPVVSIEDAGHPLALVDARGLEVDTKAPSHSHPSHADNFSILKRPMDIEADEEREEPHAEEAEEASIVPETPFALLQDLRTSPTVIEQQPVTAPSTTVSEELQPSAPEAPLAQLELFERSITEAQGLTDAADEKRRRKAARLERYRLEQDRLDEQELEQKRLEYEAKQAAEQAQEAETKEFERLAQETAERTWLEEEDLEKQRLEQEAEARQLLKRMEEEKHATEAQEKMIADEAAEQVREAEVKADEERKELESKAEQDRIDTEKSEQEAIARQLLKQMELERHAEAQESARAAEQARQEAKVKEEQHRVEIERLEVEAREAAEFAEKTQREVKQAEIARIAAEQALDEPIPDPNWSEPHQVLTTPVPQQDPVVAYTRAPIPRSAASSPHDRPASATSDRPSRSYRSPAPHVPKLRTQEAGPNHALRPQAISQLIEDNRPPAPSPPIGRARPRHVPTFDSDDDSDSALVQTRIASRRPFSGEAHEVSRSHLGPHQPRSGFASRVPVEPAYPNPPPNYHPSYYAPPAQPPHYQNHGYGMSQQGYPNPNPNPYGPSSHSSSSPYQESWSQYPPGYPPYGSPPQRQDSSGSRDYPSHAIEGRPAIEDGPGDVFSHLNVLLARYKEQHSQLSVREDSLRRASAEQEEKLRAKDGEIADLKERFRNLENKHSAETSRLHFQTGNLEEQVKELREQIAETKKFRREAEESRLVLDTAMRSWETRYKDLEDVHRALERTTAEERARTWRDFDEWKSTTNTKHDAEKIALAIQFDKKLKQADSSAEALRQEAAELEHQLGTTQKDLEEALIRERESQDVWLAERETLIEAQQDYHSVQRGWEEQRELLEVQHKEARDESDKAWTELHAEATRMAEEEKARADRLEQEKDELLKKYNQLKAESQKEKEIIKSVASNLESEKSRLEKMMECYGDIAEIKSKGDTYYLVSFSQLQKQIIDLSSTHFKHLPVRPPPEDLAQVPTNLPSFLGDTVASRQVRAAYVAHTVAKLITYRVFGPFLFSLGRRYDKADSLFSSMSHHIRDKSTRKEAIWRQQTLLAAFTSSGAKQRINTAAGTVVEEIVNAIKHFADPKEEEGIKIAVKRIVKLAAETWRFARLEREMITAIMPALQDEEHQFTSNEYWPAYKPEVTTIASLAGTSHPADEQPKLLLRIFPVIYRESKHENFHDNGESPDDGCVFHHGLALYDDAEPIVERMEELKSAGLPPYTTASPSPTDEGKFPPPACPPPRDPLPTPPAPRSPIKNATNTDDEASTQSKSTPRPSSPSEQHEKSRAWKPLPPLPSPLSGGQSPIPSKPTSTFSRPAPESVFTSPRNFIGMPVENLVTSQPPSARKKAPNVEPVSEPEEIVTPPASRAAVAEAIEAIRHQTSKESAILPPSFSRTTTQDTVQEPESPSESRAVSPLFEAIDEIESLHPSRTRTSSTSHRRRRSTATRRSTEQAVEVEEVPDVTSRPEPVRRTSTYAPSIRSSKTAETERTDKSSRTDKSDRSDKTERDKARHLYESRSAAIKALYPNSPMAGQSTNGSIKGSVKSERSEKKKDRGSKDATKDSSSRDSRESKRESRELKRQKSIPDNGTWDTNSTMTSEDFAPTHVSTNAPYRKSMETKRESRELRRRPSVSDAGTWDTNSVITHRGPATTVSTNVPYPASYDPRRDSKELKRESRELKRRPSVSDAGTWDTSSEVTYHAPRPPPTTVSTNIPYMTEFPHELRRERSIPDNGTWDTASVFTEFVPRAPPTTVSTNIPYSAQFPPELSHLSHGLRRERSIPDNGTWDTASVFTEATRRAPPTTISTNLPYPSGFLRELRRSNSVSSTGTWDTASEFTQFAHRAPPTTVSTNVPYPAGLPRQLRRSHSIASSTGTWDTSSEVTHRAAPTTISTNAPYMSQLPRQLRRDSISDDGDWDTGSDFTHANDGPVNTASKAEKLRSLKKKRSMQSNGTWDTNSVITTNDDMKTSVSTNVTYAAERRRR